MTLGFNDLLLFLLRWLSPKNRGKSNSVYSVDATKNEPCRSGTENFWQFRYTVSCLGFFVFSVLNAQRLNISIAIVSMANSTASHVRVNPINNTAEEGKYCVDDDNEYLSKNQIRGEFAWSSELQGYILGAGFIGYVVTQIPGGRLSEIFGAKLVLIISLMISSLCNLIIPAVARWDAYLLIAIQLLKGLAQGPLQPSMSFLMAKWFPSNEKALLSSVIYSGFPVGAFIAGVCTGLMCDSEMGWPLVFYTSGAIGCFCCLLLFAFLHETPGCHPDISEKELKYLSENIKSQHEKGSSIPWRAMMTSLPTWALIFGLFGQCWKAYYFLSVHPMYMGTILHYTITENGILSSAPYILQAIVSWCASYVSDWLIKRKIATLNFVRKANNTASCIGFSLCLTGVYFAECNKFLNTLFFVIAMGCIGFSFPGCVIASVDMAPNFAGTLMGIANTFASLSGFVVPVIVGIFTNEQQTIGQWRKVFLTSVIISWLSGLSFILFGSANIQKWNNPDQAGDVRRKDIVPKHCDFASIDMQADARKRWDSKDTFHTIHI